MARRFIISLLLLFLSSLAAFAAEPYNVISPTGVSATDTIALITALNTCTSTKGIFLGEGTFKIVVGINMGSAPGCTITGSITGSPTASAAGTQSTVIDCSGLSGTQVCFELGISDVLTGFTILGNGNTAGSNTICVENTTATGGNQLLNMVLRNCGIGANIGAPGCCTQNDRIVNAVFLNNGHGLVCAGNCTDMYFSDLTMISPTSDAVVWSAGGSGQLNRVVVQGLPSGANGLNMSQALYMPVTDVSVDGGGTCIYLNNNHDVTFNGVRCTGNGGANEYCIDFDTTRTYQMLFTGIVCTGGYNGSGSGVLAETGGLVGACFIPCAIDVTWNGTDPLYNSTQAGTDIDPLRYKHPFGYVPVTLTSGSFAAPDLRQGYNQSFAITSACSTPCPLPIASYGVVGQAGYFAFTQPSSPVTNPISWNAAYKNTAQPVATANKTTWFPWVTGGGGIVMGPSFHN